MTDSAAPATAAAAAPPVWRRRWFPYIVLIVVGAIAGFALAITLVRGSGQGTDRIGPWETGRDFGTADQGNLTRARVALRGLLALPASEARYYNAVTDDAGAPLNGGCTYRVTGGTLPARWWSLTAYDEAGYLIRNDQGIYSVVSTAIAPSGGPWTVRVGPGQRADGWIPTSGAAKFALTLRAYLPADGGTDNPDRAAMPSIVRESCP